jgi:hypothetical protein
MGHKWGNNSGQTWNKLVPYAIGLADGSLRTELHDTTNDHGLNDPSFKRRAEIGSADTFRNGVEYWSAYAFASTVTNLNSGFNVRISQPCHWPSGASPAIGHTIAGTKAGIEFRVSLKNDNTGNVIKGRAPIANGSRNDVVMNFKLGTSGFVRVWLNGKQIVNFTGFVGSAKEDGYSNRLGNYGTLNGASVVTVYDNIAAFPKSDNLSARITAPPVA